MEQKTKTTYPELSKPVILGWIGGYIAFVVLIYITHGILQFDFPISSAISWSAGWSIIAVVSLYFGGWAKTRIRDKLILLEAVISVWVVFFGMFFTGGVIAAGREVLIFTGFLIISWIIIFVFKKDDIMQTFRKSANESYEYQRAQGFSAGFTGFFLGLMYGIITIFITINRGEAGIIACTLLLLLPVIYLIIQGGESKIFAGKSRNAALGLSCGFSFIMFFVIVYYLVIGHL